METAAKPSDIRSIPPTQELSAGWVSADSAAEALGVKHQTLYAYVSRGLLRSQAQPGTRNRLYCRADVERLAFRGTRTGRPYSMVAKRPPLQEQRVKSQLTELREDGPHYRGHSAIALVNANHSFEAVAELLWTGKLAKRSPVWMVREGRRFLQDNAKRFGKLVRSTKYPTDLLICLNPLFGFHDPRRTLRIDEAELDVARTLIFQWAAALALADSKARVDKSLEQTSVARALLRAWGLNPNERRRTAINRALVLAADHAVDEAAFAVRLVAAAQADLYICLNAGLGVLSHSGLVAECNDFELLLEQMGSSEEVPAALRDRLQGGETLPGLGHRQYPHGDPRAAALLAWADQQPDRLPRYRTLRVLLDSMALVDATPPNLSVGLVALSVSLGLPPRSAGGLAVIGRAAGWIAHAREQRRSAPTDRMVSDCVP